MIRINSMTGHKTNNKVKSSLQILMGCDIDDNINIY